MTNPPRDQTAVSPQSARHAVVLPPIELGHLVRMTDDTGMFQHAQGAIPNRRHGYCTDDNARALIVTIRAHAHLDNRGIIDSLMDRYLAFLIHAHRRDNNRFRNFLDYGRRWTETSGSDDCQGRAIWALGVCAAEMDGGQRSGPAGRLFRESLACMEPVVSLRAMATALFGLSAYLSRFPDDRAAQRMRTTLSIQLLDSFRAAERDSRWPWPEDELTYANAHLPQALVETGHDTGDERMCRAGLVALTWLTSVQHSSGHFVPVGNRGWFPKDGEKARFDQQPIDAEATVTACMAAYRTTQDPRWLDEAEGAIRWFLGENDCGESLLDPVTGGCRDGIGVTGVNENQGAESTLAWLFAALQVLDHPPAHGNVRGSDEPRAARVRSTESG